MIKLDKILIRDTEKRFMLAAGVISIFVTIYTIPIVLIAKLQKSMQIKRFWIVLQCLAAFCFCWVWNMYLELDAEDIFRTYWNYLDNILLISPFRLMIAFLYGVLYVFLGQRMEEGVDDWTIEQEKKTREKLLPMGRYDYNDRSHMLLFGATRTGKGVALNHIIKDRLTRNRNELMVVVSAKPANGDAHSQLAYLREACEKTGRDLYVVSMDETIEDRCQYNPFEYLEQEEMMNALECMLEFDSHYYSANFTMWVMAIYDLLRAGGRRVSIGNILSLYNWEKYCTFAKQLLESGKITEEEYDEFTSSMNENHSEIAKNDSANLKKIERNCRSVFRKTPNGIRINITDAFEEDAIIYFDLNAVSSGSAVKMLGGACIMAELQHCLVEFCDSDQKKTIILDEASAYMNEHLVKAFFNMSASMGYQFIISTQGPSDLGSSDGNLISQLNNNLGQLATLRVSDPDDVEMINGLIGTTITAENTHRAQSIDYDLTGSIKAKDQMHVPHDVIKNLEPLTMIYYQKSKSVNGEARPVKVKWRLDDMEIRKCPKQKEEYLIFPR